MLLHQYDIGHYLRNTPLINLGAFYKATNATLWREVFPNFNIAKNTYNQLGDVWTEGQEWKATVDPLAWNEERMDVIGQNGNIGYET